jgi:hypothetical protein
MPVSYTVDDLIVAVKRRAIVPSNQGLYSEPILAEFLNDEMQQTVVPLIMSVREDYFVKKIDVVTENSEFQIPSDAIGMKVRNIGKVVNEKSFYNLPRLSYAELNERNSGFIVEGNTVKIIGQIAGPFRVFYFKRPLQLKIVSSITQQITAIDTNTNTITVGGVDQGWNTLTELNIIQNFQPFDSIENIFPVSATYPDYVLPSVEKINIGDWITTQGFSPIAQLPVEAQKTLVQATVVKVLEAMGDREGMAAAEKKLEDNIKSMFNVLTPRVDGSPKKIVNSGISEWI